jgi:hypothetical protein
MTIVCAKGNSNIYAYILQNIEKDPDFLGNVITCDES